jgi:hypothetical protein
MFSLLVDEGELDIFATMFLILFVNGFDKFFQVSHFLFGHCFALSYY